MGKTVQRAKWHTERRNLQVGDVVLVADDSALRSSYKLALVVESFKDKHDRVRHVNIMYKNVGTEPSKIYKGKVGTVLKRDVRKLVLLLPVEEQEGAGIFAAEDTDGRK